MPSGPNPDCCRPTPTAVAAWNVLRDEIRTTEELTGQLQIAALAVIGSRPDVLVLLEEALRDRDATGRKTTAIALGDLQAQASQPALRALLDDESPEWSLLLPNALWKMGDRSGRGIFIATLSGENKGDGLVKSTVKSNFAKYSDPKSLAMTGVKEAAGHFWAASDGITIAQELMKDHTAAARAECAALLAKDASPEAVRELTQALTDKNWGSGPQRLRRSQLSPGKVSPMSSDPLLNEITEPSETLRPRARFG